MMMASDQSFGGGRNLSSNHFTGPIPKEIGMIFNLDRMWVPLNLYPGTLIADRWWKFYISFSVAENHFMQSWYNEYPQERVSLSAEF